MIEVPFLSREANLSTLNLCQHGARECLVRQAPGDGTINTASEQQNFIAVIHAFEKLVNPDGPVVNLRLVNDILNIPFRVSQHQGGATNGAGAGLVSNVVNRAEL